MGESANRADSRQDGGTQPTWPICPECGKGRHTSCPVCGTSGNRFPPGDGGYALAAGEGERDEAARLWICPTCDEPFTPVFLRRCEWCGHDFGDGVAGPRGAGGAEDFEPINGRVLLAVAGLAVTLLAALAYFLAIAS